MVHLFRYRFYPVALVRIRKQYVCLENIFKRFTSVADLSQLGNNRLVWRQRFYHPAKHLPMVYA